MKEVRGRSVGEGSGGKERVGTCNAGCSMRSNTAPEVQEGVGGVKQPPGRTVVLGEGDNIGVVRGGTAARSLGMECNV